MAHLHPFKPWRPGSNNVEEVACVPYDVINVAEARQLAAGNPNSFLHVIRPEVDLPEGTDPHADEVYIMGANTLSTFFSKQVLKQDKKPGIYIYRLIHNDRSQTGIFACASVADYDNEIILKHELTRPAKEDDRTRHILSQQAHAEPVMLTYKDQEQLQQLIDQKTEEEPLYDFVAPDGVAHQLWKAEHTQPFVENFKQLEHLYIADGHHRCKSASRAAEEKKRENEKHTGREEYNFFPAVLFPMSNMHIMAYNRVIHNAPSTFLEQLNESFDLKPDARPEPSQKGDLSVYIDGTWYGMHLPMDPNPTSVEQLDVHRLKHFILDPMLDITDPRRDENISFVGGIRGTQGLEKLVNSGKADIAISMYPTGIEELVEVSDEGRLMPPKSTWFEPKLRSGLLVHTF